MDQQDGILGLRLKQIRKGHGWTLTDVAGRTGISVSTLSKLENGLTQMNFTNVRKLAEGLGLSVTELTRNPAQSPVISARRCITPSGEGAAFETNDVDYEILCNEISGSQQGYIKARIKTHDVNAVPEFRRHDGQEFIYVLAGVLELHTETYAPTVLKTGDSILFDSAVGHKYISRGKQDAVVLISMPLHGYTDVTDSLDEINANHV